MGRKAKYTKETKITIYFLMYKYLNKYFLFISLKYPCTY